MNDIGTEELAHLEMIGTMVHQLMDKVLQKSLKSSMLIQIMLFTAELFILPILMVFHLPQHIESMEDPIANLNEDLAAEEKPVHI